MMHLAELNIGKFKYPTSDLRMAGFMNNLDRINALADRSEGFVWRLKSDGSNNATDLRVGDDYALNMSVWKDAKALENYVFKTAHAQIYRRKAEFFELMEKPHMVFWPVPEGHIPSLTEALERLQDYETNGATERAFGWAEVMDIERMRSLRCA
jgi:hypothetical protein